jgi:hypothetical protein
MFLICSNSRIAYEKIFTGELGRNSRTRIGAERRQVRNGGTAADKVVYLGKNEEIACAQAL